ncbi:CU044_2847 family protein [Streptomyces sp. NPDC055092]
MLETVEFLLADGTVVHVSPTERTGGGPVGLGDHLGRARQSLRQALAPVTAAASDVIDEFRAHTRRPDEIEVSFGVTLDMQVGAIISTAKASTHLDVRLRWSGQRPADDDLASPGTPGQPG